MLAPVFALAQDPQVSQFYAASLYTNPAFAGASRKIRVAVTGRNQYTALNNNYRTAIFGADMYLRKANSGLGLLASYDVAGDGFLTSTGVSAVYAYNQNINRDWAFSAAISAGIIQKTFDFNRFTFLDQLDPVRGVVRPSAELQNPPLEQRTIPNFGTGVLVYSDYFYGGLAVNNLLEPNQSFYYQNADSASLRLPRRYTAHAGANIYLTQSRYEENQLLLSPNILFMQQRSFYQINAGFYIRQKALTFGTYFRQTSANADAVIFLLGLKFPSVRVGYSYDAVISNARTATIGSHEISLVIEIATKPRGGYRKDKLIKCPAL